MEIHEIKLINGGFKGIACYITEERKMPNGRKYIDKDWKEMNDTIHLALDKSVKSLRKYLLEICGCLGDESNQSQMDYNVAETEITSIKISKTFFILEGDKEWLNNKRFKLKTPKIEEKDGFVNYSTVIEILADIKKEAEIYMKGSAKVSDEEAAIRWLSSGKDKLMTEENYHNMTKEEKTQWHKEWLESEVGGMVTLQDDVTDVEEEVKAEDVQEFDLM